MLKYIQKTGDVFHFEDGLWVPFGKGYSGHGEGLNYHEKELVKDIGPIPCGLWAVSKPYKDEHKGPMVFRLTPLTYFGMRSGFLIHGDNSTPEPNDASIGCIILSPSYRQKISEWKVAYLIVEANIDQPLS